MAKFASILILVGAIITVQALQPTYDEILVAAKENQWDQVQQLLRNNFAKNADFKGQPAVFDGVRNLKPVDGGHVYGEAEYSFHSASKVGGKTTEDHAGHKVINSDGKVKEFDFTPKTAQPPVLPPLNPSRVQFGNDYSASDNSFQYAPASAEQAGNFNKQPAFPPNLPANNQYFGNTPNQGGQLNQGGLGNLEGQLSQGGQLIQGGPLNQGGQLSQGLPLNQGGQLNQGFPLNLEGQLNQGALPIQGGQGHHHSYNHQYSWSQTQHYINGKPVDASLFKDGKLISPLTFTEIKDLKPPQGGQVFGEAQFQYQTSSNVDGKVSEDAGGHKVINDNGQVQEFDLTPVPNKSPVVNYSYNN